MGSGRENPRDPGHGPNVGPLWGRRGRRKSDLPQGKPLSNLTADLLNLAGPVLQHHHHDPRPGLEPGGVILAAQDGIRFIDGVLEYPEYHFLLLDQIASGEARHSSVLRKSAVCACQPRCFSFTMSLYRNPVHNKSACRPATNSPYKRSTRMRFLQG